MARITRLFLWAWVWAPILLTMSVFSLNEAQAEVAQEVNPVESCISSAVEEAIHMRSIQSKLMIAALSCPGAREQYNKFAVKFRKPMLNNAAVLKKYFKCRSGKKATYHMDKIVTKIANIAAKMNSRNHDTFCDEADEIFAILKDLDAQRISAVCTERAYIDIDDLRESNK